VYYLSGFQDIDSIGDRQSRINVLLYQENREARLLKFAYDVLEMLDHDWS
jgi:hypothetical protein